MPLPTSGEISLNDIHIEAGGTTGTQAGINDSDIRGLISAASESEIEFTDFYGASALTITFNGGSIYHISANNPSAGIRFNTTGTITEINNNNGSYTNIGWGSPVTTGLGSDYEIYATRISGVASPTTGTVNTWLALSSNRQWTMQSTIGGLDRTIVLQFSIRDAATQTVLDTANITLTADNIGGFN